MAKNKISEYSATPADNTDISNINIAEGCSPANVNNAIRSLMAQIKNLQAGTSGDTIPIAAGGTGSATATDARTALSAAKSGANSDITSITGLTTPLTTAQGGTGTASTTFANLTTNVTGTLPVANGGTNQTSYTDGQLLIGNTTGNTLTKATLTAGSGVTITNGSGSITIAAASGVTSLNGQTGAITNTGYGDIGSYYVGYGAINTAYSVGSTIAGSSLAYINNSTYGGFSTITSGNAGNTIGHTIFAQQGGTRASSALSGTWRCMTHGGDAPTTSFAQLHLWVRVS